MVRLTVHDGDAGAVAGPTASQYQEAKSVIAELALTLEHDDPLRDACRDFAAALSLRVARMGVR